jgi:O-antigen chain-terminating methyltransferase
MLYLHQSSLDTIIQNQNILKSRLEELDSLVDSQQNHIDALLEHNHQHHLNHKESLKSIKLQVRKQITSQSILFHKRVAEFISKLDQNLSSSDRDSHKEYLSKEAEDFFLDDYYLAFEDRYRGSRDSILNRYRPYLKYLPSDIKKALDLGCGRAEWVELLSINSIDSYGCDQNSAMLEKGREKGLKNLINSDIFKFLKSQDDSSFDLISAFHLIEHIPYRDLIKLIQEIKRVATCGATILLETPNPKNIVVSTYEFYKDPTHLSPLPSDLVVFMLEYLGFKDIKVEYLHPFESSFYIDEDTKSARALNNYLFQARDYLIIAKNSKEI